MASRDGDGGRHLRGVLREAHRRGFPGGDAGISSVEGELEGLGSDPFGAEGDPKVSEERTVVDARSLLTVSVRSAFAYQEDECGVPIGNGSASMTRTMKVVAGRSM
jgi:hypothetical protein